MTDTLADKISRALAERIIHGEIRPGSRLRQDEIATQFESSHVPVREAFRRLEARGLAVSSPRRGVRVSPLEFAEVKEVAEMRSALEGLALRHAAPHLTPDILDRAEAFNEAGEAATSVRAWEQANRGFHRSIVEPCGMPRLLAAIDELHTLNARYLFGVRAGKWSPVVNQDHRAILAALRFGQTDAAVMILSRHVQWIEGRQYGFS